ncbi:MAG: outer membrane lipoprotein carrier protein LolA [Chitinophagaceae bacterium]
MKKTLIALFALISLQSFAQNDPNAKKILDGVSNKFKSFKTVQATYNLTVTNKAGKNAGSKTGTIYLKGQKYQITDKGLQIYSDGSKVWKFEPAANEVSTSMVDPNNQAITPAKLLSNFYEKDFSYKLIGNKNVGGKQLAEIELTPTTKGRNFTKVIIYVDQTKQMIISTKVFEISGNMYTYGISNLKTNTNLTDNMFTFDKTKHPGVEEIEQ